MYTGARLPWGTLNQAGWLGDGPARGVTRMATTGRKPLPWGTLNPGGYLGAFDVNQLIHDVAGAAGQIFGGGNNQNAAQTPGSGLTYPAYVPTPQPAGMFGGVSPVVLVGALALGAVLLMKRR